MAGYIVVSVEETQNTNQHGRNHTMMNLTIGTKLQVLGFKRIYTITKITKTGRFTVESNGAKSTWGRKYIEETCEIVEG
jgi:hypothetical protein